jgi:hypothetical protein
VGKERSGPAAPPTGQLASRRRAYVSSFATADRFDIRQLDFAAAQSIVYVEIVHGQSTCRTISRWRGTLASLTGFARSSCLQRTPQRRCGRAYTALD